MSTLDLPVDSWRERVAAAWEGKRKLDDPAVRGAVEGAVAALDAGTLRVAEPDPNVPDSEDRPWITHGWLQQAIGLYFRIHVSQTIEAFCKSPSLAGPGR